MENEISQIVQILGTATDATLTEYVKWMVTSSLVWISIGSLICLLGVFFLVAAFRWDDGEVVAVFSIIALVIGLAMVGSNIADYFQPKAAAIHQLLKDAR